MWFPILPLLLCSCWRPSKNTTQIPPSTFHYFYIEWFCICPTSSLTLLINSFHLMFKSLRKQYFCSRNLLVSVQLFSIFQSHKVMAESRGCPSGARAPPLFQPECFHHVRITCRTTARWRPPAPVPQIRTFLTHYKPISLLPQFSKILKKLYNNRMDNFLKKYDILNPSQYAFRSNMSTTKAILELVELENRQQFVNFNNCDSEILNVSCGVPQGSILGPKLFIMYVNDICKVSKVFRFIIFDDDTNLLCCHSDELVRMTNAGLDQLQVWFSVNLNLSFNVTKTNYSFFGNRKLTVDISVKINKETINRVNVTKCLGVMIDDKLN